MSINPCVIATLGILSQFLNQPLQRKLVQNAVNRRQPNLWPHNPYRLIHYQRSRVVFTSAHRLKHRPRIGIHRLFHMLGHPNNDNHSHFSIDSI